MASKKQPKLELLLDYGWLVIISVIGIKILSSFLDSSLKLINVEDHVLIYLLHFKAFYIFFINMVYLG